jgi:formylglycine-generating enzyme required for sulfatase activity
MRADAAALFAKDEVKAAEKLRRTMSAREEEVDQIRRDELSTLGRALAIDPYSVAARSLSADVLFARWLAAERVHHDELMGELAARLGEYDDGSRVGRLSAPARVRFEADPPDSALVLSHYAEDGARHLVAEGVEPIRPGEARELPAGSYLLVASHPGRLETRYPFAVARGEERALRVTMPLPEAVPPGMIYIPAGRFLYGSVDEEPDRVGMDALPGRELDLPAFLISRFETTYADYLAYLRAIPEPQRAAKLPERLSISPQGIAHVKLRLSSPPITLAEGEPYCLPPNPCVDWRRLPVLLVTRDDAEAFASWADRASILPGARLCSDAEWERAARGADDRRFPLGNGAPTGDEACVLATYGGDVAHAGPCAVGTHPASRSPFGVEDMVGNVNEWVASSPALGAGMGATRSGTFRNDGIFLWMQNHAITPSTSHMFDTGMRLCADAR